MWGDGSMTGGDSKIAWEGEVLSVQPRIRLTRSFDQCSHGYLERGHRRFAGSSYYSVHDGPRCTGGQMNERRRVKPRWVMQSERRTRG